VIRPLDDDEILAPRVRARQPERELVRLASGADEEEDAQRLRERRGEPVRVRKDRRMEVTRVRVEQSHLPGARGDDPGVRVSDVRHVVHDVEVRGSRFVVEELARAADDLEGLAVGEGERRSEETSALRAQRFAPGTHPSDGAAEDRARIGAER